MHTKKVLLTVKLTLEESEEVKSLAARARMTVSELVRQWIRLGELPVRERDVQRQKDWRQKP